MPEWTPIRQFSSAGNRPFSGRRRRERRGGPDPPSSRPRFFPWRYPWLARRSEGIVSRVQGDPEGCRRPLDRGLRHAFAEGIFLPQCGIEKDERERRKNGFKQGSTAGRKGSSKIVANDVRTLLRSLRCTAHHQPMGSSKAHAQEHDCYRYCGGPIDTSVC